MTEKHPTDPIKQALEEARVHLLKVKRKLETVKTDVPPDALFSLGLALGFVGRALIDIAALKAAEDAAYAREQLKTKTPEELGIELLDLGDE